MRLTWPIPQGDEATELERNLGIHNYFATTVLLPSPEDRMGFFVALFKRRSDIGVDGSWN